MLFSCFLSYLRTIVNKGWKTEKVVEFLYIDNDSEKFEHKWLKGNVNIFPLIIDFSHSDKG